MKQGAFYRNGKAEFVVWAPFADRVAVRLVHPEHPDVSMEKDEGGYWRAEVDSLPPDARYFYLLDGETLRPAPASHFQPEGVHGPSEVVDHSAFQWENGDWEGLPPEEMLIYELHVGAFTPAGDFDGVVSRLDYLAELGVNAVELMPVAQFPGERNWGYDGVFPYAVQNSYGGPEGLKRLVNECHKRRLAVILDVVYNHLGPEGNYLRDFGPYFTDRYKTPWGDAVNFDGPYSDPVRDYFIENAVHWFDNYGVDALRVDAVHAIYDFGAKHFLKELSERVADFSEKSGRKRHLIAESDLNDARIVLPHEKGGYGLDAQWCDDFHHSLHSLLTGETDGYYADFGDLEHLAKSYREGFVYDWKYSVFRKKRFGSSSRDIPAGQFVAFSANHDQVGNRMLGERPSALLSFEAVKLAAGAVLFSPYIPMLFMGEEYGEPSPFLYFVDHSDPELIEAVRKGRAEEFKAFRWQGKPSDPQDADTFNRSKLQWELTEYDKHATLLNFYKELIRLRKESAPLRRPDKSNLKIWSDGGEKVLFFTRGDEKSGIFCIMSFEGEDKCVKPDYPDGRWKKILDSSDEKWLGPGPSLPEVTRPGEDLFVRQYGVVLFERQDNS